MIGRGDTGTPATVWLVRYDPRMQNVAIRAGENGDRPCLKRTSFVRSRRSGHGAGRQ